MAHVETEIDLWIAWFTHCFVFNVVGGTIAQGIQGAKTDQN